MICKEVQMTPGAEEARTEEGRSEETRRKVERWQKMGRKPPRSTITFIKMYKSLEEGSKVCGNKKPFYEITKKTS